MEFTAFTYALIAGDSDATIWIQMLVVVMLLAGVGLYSLARGLSRKRTGANEPRYSRAGRADRWERLKIVVAEGKEKWVDGLVDQVKDRVGNRERTNVVSSDHPDVMPAEKSSSRANISKRSKSDWQRDLTGGMELLELRFLVGVAENTASKDMRDIEMRRLCFSELCRRKKLVAIGSKALARYATDQRHFYDKQIQCEAMTELTRRTVDSAQTGLDRR